MKRANFKINPQEVWSAWVDYEDDPSQGKYRPVIVISVENEIARVLSVPLTSAKPRDEYDIEVFDWEYIPLEHISTARISKVLLIPISDFRKKIGKLTDDDWDNVIRLLSQYG